MANSVRIGVGVDDRASRPIRDIHDAFKRLQADGAKGLGIGLGAAAGLAVWKGAQQAISGVADVLGDAVRAASEEEDSIASLTSSLKANIPGWDGNTQAIEALLASRMRLGHSDDEQRQSLALLVASTHDSAKALDLERVAMDLAAFKRVDLATASEALIKIEGGQFRALKALIGSTEDITTSEQALAAVHSATAGAAEALANTNSGKLKASNIALSESMERLGAKILPGVADAMSGLADVVTAATPALDLLGGSIAAALSPITAGVTALGSLRTALGGQSDAVLEATRNIRHLASVQADLDKQYENGSLSTKDYREQSAAVSRVLEQEQAALKAANDALDAATRSSTTAGVEAAKVATAIATQTVATLSAKDATDLSTEATNQAARASLALSVAVGTAVGATDEQKRAAADAKAEFDKLGTVFDGFNSVVVESARGMDEFGFHSRDAMDDASAAFYKAGGAANDLKDILDSLPKEKTIDVNVRFFQSGAGALGVGAFPEPPAGNTDFGSVDGATADLGGTSADPEVVAREEKARREKREREAKAAREKAEREAKQAADKALRDAKQAAAEHARAVHEQLDTAYDKLKDTAKEAFQTIHEGNLKSIQDAHDAANAALDAQEKAIRGRVSGERSRLQELRDARHERELRENVANASPADRADAVQALTDFLDDQRIARLESDADTNVAVIEAQKTANDALAQADRDREDTRYKGQQKALDDELKLLKSHLDKYTKNWAAAFAEIAKEAKKLGVDKLLGVKPVAVTSAAASAVVPSHPIPSVVPAVSTGLPPGKTLEGSVIHNHFYVDGREVSTVVMDRLAGHAALKSPTLVSTGSMR